MLCEYIVIYSVTSHINISFFLSLSRSLLPFANIKMRKYTSPFGLGFLFSDTTTIGEIVDMRASRSINRTNPKKALQVVMRVNRDLREIILSVS